MLKLHTSDGLTARIDLADEEQARELIRQLRDPAYQASISGTSLAQEYAARARCPGCGRACRLVCTECPPDASTQARPEMSAQYSLTRPAGFHRVSYQAEALELEGGKGGERIVCYADDTCLTVMVHRSQPSVRITLTKTGKQRYNPVI